jgi:hypothetical protein
MSRRFRLDTGIVLVVGLSIFGLKLSLGRFGSLSSSARVFLASASSLSLYWRIAGLTPLPATDVVVVVVGVVVAVAKEWADDVSVVVGCAINFLNNF